MNKHHFNMMGFKCFEMHWMLLQSNLHIYELNKAQWRQNIQGMLNGTWFFGQGKVRVAQKRACYQKILNGQKNYLDRFSMYVPISQECFQKRQRHRAFISRTFFLITTKSSSFPSRGRVTSSPKTQWTMKLKRRAFTIHQCKLNS